MECEYAIIGSGIIGLAIAKSLKQNQSDCSIIIFDKERKSPSRSPSACDASTAAAIESTPPEAAIIARPWTCFPMAATASFANLAGLKRPTRAHTPHRYKAGFSDGGSLHSNVSKQTALSHR